MRVAVVGAGWAGLAAAVAATQAGHQVQVFEAARTLGGRARVLHCQLPDGSPVALDNGQHILIGAYTQTLALLHTVGVDVAQALHRAPLCLQFPDGQGLRLGTRAYPLNLLWGLLTLPGWSAYDKWTLLRAAGRWQLQGFACAPKHTVADLCHTLSPRAMETLIEPLCVSALNTPSHQASGAVFLRVLRDALFGGPGSADLLLPQVDLSTLLPEAAARWLVQHGAVLHRGRRIAALHAGLQSAPASAEGAIHSSTPHWHLDGTPFDAVVWATGPKAAAQAVAATADSCPAPLAGALFDWAAGTHALRYEAITTVYAHASRARLPTPMLALRSNAEHPAQFVFDRGQLGGPAGLLAFVVSASKADRDTVQNQVLAQAQAQLAHCLHGSPITPVQTVVEKHATFACTPALRRPAQAIAPGLVACGDYTAGPYPATLEGAVRAGLAAADSLGAGGGTCASLDCGQGAPAR
jgi:squalene-associated FAD-dependent desaturase